MFLGRSFWQRHPRLSSAWKFLSQCNYNGYGITTQVWLVPVWVAQAAKPAPTTPLANCAVVVSYLINLAAYHAAFFAAAVLELIAVGWALTIYDSDAAATLRRPAKQAG